MITDFYVRMVENSCLSNKEQQRIIMLKQQHWHHPMQSQINWMKENIRNGEYHLWLGQPDGQIIAYLNFVFLSVRFENRVEELVGIGNVCVDKALSGKGIGLLLMQICNYYIKCQDKKAVLLCRKDLVSFYKKSGWKEYLGSTVLLGKEYKESIMFSVLPEEKRVEIERNF